jgi:hypothetical protein
MPPAEEAEHKSVWIFYLSLPSSLRSFDRNRLGRRGLWCRSTYYASGLLFLFDCFGSATAAIVAAASSPAEAVKYPADSEEQQEGNYINDPA